MTKKTHLCTLEHIQEAKNQDNVISNCEVSLELGDSDELYDVVFSECRIVITADADSTLNNVQFHNCPDVRIEGTKATFKNLDFLRCTNINIDIELCIIKGIIHTLQSAINTWNTRNCRIDTISIETSTVLQWRLAYTAIKKFTITDTNVHRAFWSDNRLPILDWNAVSFSDSDLTQQRLILTDAVAIAFLRCALPTKALAKNKAVSLTACTAVLPNTVFGKKA